jgi:hypothetical protein
MCTPRRRSFPSGCSTSALATAPPRPIAVVTVPPEPKVGSNTIGVAWAEGISRTASRQAASRNRRPDFRIAHCVDARPARETGRRACSLPASQCFPRDLELVGLPTQRPLQLADLPAQLPLARLAASSALSARSRAARARPAHAHRPSIRRRPRTAASCRCPRARRCGSGRRSSGARSRRSGGRTLPGWW